MKKLLSLLILSVSLFPHCKVVKYTPEKFPVKQLIFGNGGGFAGIETSYLLLENGQVFKRVGINNSYAELLPIKGKKTKELYSKLNAVQLYKLDVDKPGNLYYFLQQVTENTDSRATWGAGDYLPPQNLVSIYRELYALVKDRKLLKENQVGPASEDKEKKKESDATKW